MRKILMMAAVAMLAACGPKTGSTGSKVDAASVAGEWSVFSNDAKVNSYHLTLAPKGGEVVATKVFDEDIALGDQKHAKGSTESWATFSVAGKNIDGTLAAAGADRKLSGTVHDDGKGLSLHTGKGDLELRRK